MIWAEDMADGEGTQEGFGPHVSVTQLLRALHETNAHVATLQAVVQQQQAVINAVPHDGGGTRLKTKEPEAYDGKRDSVVVAQWQHQVAMHLQLQNVPVGQQVVFASTFLRGPALNWWLQREAAVRNGTAPALTDLTEFFRATADQFVPRDGWQIAQDKLSRLYQKGSISAYSEEFLNLVLCIPNMMEREKVHLFAIGLKRETRKEVMLRQCDKLDEAMRVADRMDAISSELRGWGRYASSQGTQRADVAAPMEL